MPIVHVYVWKGFSNEAKKKVIAGITKLFTEINVPVEACMPNLAASEFSFTRSRCFLPSAFPLSFWVQ
jgi:hypothetical protein